MSEQSFPYPEKGDLVTMAVGERERMLATVRAITPEGADLLLQRAPPAAPAGEGELAAHIDFAAIDGMWRVQGRLAHAERAGADGGIRVRFDVSGTPELVQRRQFVRTDLETKVTLFPGNELRLRGDTINVSAGGLLATGVPELQLGDEMRFALYLPGMSSVTGRCRVVRAQEEGLRAVRFLGLRRQTQHRLMRYLFECEQSAPAAVELAQPATPPQPADAAGAPQVDVAAIVDGGVMLWRRGDAAGARDAYQRAIDSGDREQAPRASLNLAVAQYEAGDLEGARASYQRVVDSGHPDQAPRAALNLGFLLIERGDVEGARTALQRAVDLADPAVRPLASGALRQL